ncbi:MAG: c-type cytochrome [Deltaproteobacteria bacterium]|nr:c-type cytochrome [Deltaproteobacteria bacterium]
MALSRTASRNIFVLGSIGCAVALLAMTIDFHRVAAERTREAENLTEASVRGKEVWEKYNCVNCHGRLGEGAYYAPDLTVAYERMGAGWIEHMLKDPQTAYWGPPENAVGRRKMPHLKMTDEEVADMIEFLKFLNGINRNNWPPEGSWPRGVPIPPGTDEAKGEHLFETLGCRECHGANGRRSRTPVGPDLTYVSSRLPREWIKQEIQVPAADYPETKMPDFSVSDEDTELIIRYLDYINEKGGGIIGGHPKGPRTKITLATPPKVEEPPPGSEDDLFGGQ